MRRINIKCLWKIIFQQHTNIISLARGTKLKSKYFDTRREALDYMYKYCAKHSIHVELSENDKHEKKYSNHQGVRFYINRV